MMRRILFLITPPFIVRGVRWLLEVTANKVFKTNVSDYSNRILIRNTINKTISVKETISERNVLAMESYRIAFGILSCKEHPKVILDFGGGAGYQYFNLTKITGRNYKWYVIETKEFTELANLSPELSEVIFFSTFEEFESENVVDLDLVFCSRALQYAPDPELICKQISNLNPKNIFFTGVTLSPDSEPHNLIQHSMLSSNGPGSLPSGTKDIRVSYQFKLVPIELILKHFEANYQLRFRTSEEPVIHLYKSKAIPYSGIFLTRKDQILK
jgi:putative methyltransferase (TIGR04325 family)